MQLVFSARSVLARLKRSGYLSVEPRLVANHRLYLPSTCTLCVLRTLLVLLSGSQESKDLVWRGEHLWTSIKYRNEPSKRRKEKERFERVGPDPHRPGPRPREIRSGVRWGKWKSAKERKRNAQPKTGQTGPRLAEVASGPQTINKERSNLWTGSLISTLLLFSHLIDGLQCRFVLPPLCCLVQQLLFFPAFLSPSFLSFSREINTHSWTGRATGEPRRLGDELSEGYL